MKVSAGRLRGNTEGTQARARAGTNVHSFLGESFAFRGFRGRGDPPLPALLASELNGKECDEGGPPRLAGSGLSAGSYREEARVQCCTPVWISVAGVSTSTCSIVRVRRSRSVRCRPTPMACAVLSERLHRHGEPIRAAIESMNGARFVHDRLELAGWQVEIADAQKASSGGSSSVRYASQWSLSVGSHTFWHSAHWGMRATRFGALRLLTNLSGVCKAETRKNCAVLSQERGRLRNAAEVRSLRVGGRTLRGYDCGACGPARSEPTAAEVRPGEYARLLGRALKQSKGHGLRLMPLPLANYRCDVSAACRR
jgi:hypothetical protein